MDFSFLLLLLSTVWAKVASGALVGFLVGLTGVGGGSLMTPLLTLILGVPATIAVGTDLAFAAITKSFGVLAYRGSQLIQWVIVRRLMMGSLPAAVLTTFVLKWTDFDQTGVQYVRYVIAFSIFLTMLGLLCRQAMLRRISRWSNWPLSGYRLVWATAGLGAIIGVLVTVSSIGAGVVGVVAMLFLYPHLKPAQLAATDICYAVPMTAVSALGHLWLNTIDGKLLLALLMGSIPAIWFGAKLARCLPEKVTRTILAMVLALVALKMVI